MERGPYVSYANCGLPYHAGGVIPRASSLLVADERTFRQQFAIDVRTVPDVKAIHERIEGHTALPTGLDPTRLTLRTTCHHRWPDDAQVLE